MSAALQAYENNSKTLAQGRVTEALAFSKAARLLDDARSRPEDRAALREALRFNRVVWTCVQADITQKKNALPRRLKASLMSLSLFVDKTMEQITIEPESSSLQALIDIDRDMAAGLIADQPAN
ncbi:MAG: flagellar biosynthesis regulator FlaF [Rhodospirillaceae bacterium]|nr:flagellar biosynthesis regulator FlaF [Rhodospirillaceae bacterium]MBT5513342.1 flagellar biosynthesis regulator FlaF [Rhodospirillaceae bacterium]MBT6087831.1 flagellar biosynthesis regulator FlaF [Rhodospirillaceae bacterium]MBT6609393.1 flagellar biosynthesis regulator FlaF [Rhodospirillaceae bacterium]MBT7249163.1 flagellar biosynthesis regulator FlaF [Rhodospirillaceae bacterium]